MGRYELDQIDNIVNEMLDFTGARTAQLAQEITISLAESTPRDTGLGPVRLGYHHAHLARLDASLDVMIAEYAQLSVHKSGP